VLIIMIQVVRYERITKVFRFNRQRVECFCIA